MGPSLPRSFFPTRGDAAPPHTRGWTRAAAEDEHPARGSPAHAGMDPSQSGSPSHSQRLPRTRGDGPRAVGGVDGAAGAPPHTRGWTPLERGLVDVVDGSPAHAGMDPEKSCLAASACRLPRTRGDGPSLNSARHGRHVGSPAHAGMDPDTESAPVVAAGLPRTRGDGPALRWKSRSAGPAPPHTRGWTQPRAPDQALRGGSPAHAGMDPGPSRPRTPSTRLPRTRGDGPLATADTDLQAVAPPHTRGWTLSGDGTRQVLDGSPAHAGMDPSDTLERPGAVWLPRTRGDGPA